MGIEPVAYVENVVKKNLSANSLITVRVDFMRSTLLHTLTLDLVRLKTFSPSFFILEKDEVTY